MPAFTEGGISDVDQLKSFVDEVRSLLARIVETGTDTRGGRVIPEDLHADLRAAWNDLKPEFDSLRAAIPKSESRLREHGLFGAQLRFKLGVIGQLWDRFISRGGLRLYWWLLSGIDGVLDSLIDATGIGAAIRELKEAMIGAGELLEE